MKRIVAGLFFFSGISLSAQVTFQKSYGGASNDNASDIAVTDDGGYIFTGSSSTFGTYDLYVVKTDSNGDTLWSKSYYNSSIESNGASIAQAADGGYVITGEAFMTTGIPLIKLDSSGNVVWMLLYSDSGHSIGKKVIAIDDGGFMICAYTAGTTATQDAVLIRTDSVGNVLWNKSYGGSNFDRANSVQPTSNGFIMAGITRSFGFGNQDLWLCKIDTSGNLLWSKTYGGTNYEWAIEIVNAQEGGYVIAGGAGGIGNLVMKIDTIGNTLWAKSYSMVGDLPVAFIADGSEYAFLTNDGNVGGHVLSRIDSTGHVLASSGRHGTIGTTNLYGGMLAATPTGYVLTANVNYIMFPDLTPQLICTDKNGFSNCVDSIYPLMDTAITLSTMNIVPMVTNRNYVGTPLSLITRHTGNPQTLCFSGVGVDEGEELAENLLVFPNPANDVFHFQFAYPASRTYVLYNSMGEIVQTITISESKADISVSSLSRGIYFCTITEGGKSYESCSLIIDR